MGFFDKLKEKFGGEGKEEKEVVKEVQKQDLNKGLEKTNRSFFDKISKAVAGKSKVDIDMLDDIEEILMSSDVSLDTTVKIIDRLEARVAKDKFINSDDLRRLLKEEMHGLLSESNTPDNQGFTIPDTGGKPYILMVVGVNGVGKTTTIGKLAARFKMQGKKVLLGAGDTFRAAAIAQLEVWAERTECPIIANEMGSDPASTAFDTAKAAKEGEYDIVLLDTAGRLHNKVGLMNELTKIKRVMKKIDEDFPHDVMLVLDGSTGQNALEQAKQFTAATDVTCLTVTKLDGTAKGGVVLAIADQFKIPIKYIGVGEQVHQLQAFDKTEFIDSLFQGI